MSHKRQLSRYTGTSVATQVRRRAARVPRAGQRTGEEAMKGLLWMLLGLAVGLMVAPRSGANARQEVLARVNQVFGS